MPAPFGIVADPDIRKRIHFDAVPEQFPEQAFPHLIGKRIPLRPGFLRGAYKDPDPFAEFQRFGDHLPVAQMHRLKPAYQQAERVRFPAHRSFGSGRNAGMS